MNKDEIIKKHAIGKVTSCYFYDNGDVEFRTEEQGWVLIKNK